MTKWKAIQIGESAKYEVIDEGKGLVCVTDDNHAAMIAKLPETVAECEKLRHRLAELQNELSAALGFIGECPHHVFKYPKEVVALYERNARFVPVRS
jgi:hypothetical protein